MTRKRKPIFFVACEGAHNKTESNYLQHFKNNNGVLLKIKPTSNTAPETMLDISTTMPRTTDMRNAQATRSS